LSVVINLDLLEGYRYGFVCGVEVLGNSGIWYEGGRENKKRKKKGGEGTGTGKVFFCNGRLGLGRGVLWG